MDYSPSPRFTAENLFKRAPVYIHVTTYMYMCYSASTVVSRASAHSRVSAHVPHFNGSM